MAPPRPIPYEPPLTHSAPERGERLTDQDGNDPEPAGVRIGRSTGAMLEEQQAAAKAAADARAAKPNKWTGMTVQKLVSPWENSSKCDRCGEDAPLLTRGIDRSKVCSTCNGEGAPKLHDLPCKHCNGTGTITVEVSK